MTFCKEFLYRAVVVSLLVPLLWTVFVGPPVSAHDPYDPVCSIGQYCQRPSPIGSYADLVR